MILKLLLLLLIGYVLLNLYILHSRLKYRHLKSPYVPISLVWFLGLIPDIRRRSKKEPMKSISDFFIDYHKETGWDTFVMPIFTRNIIFCIDLGVISKVLIDHKTFFKNRDQQTMLANLAGVRLFGNYGLLNDPGTDLWHAKRRIMDPAFHRSFLKTTMSGMNKVSARLNETLKTKSDNNVEFDITFDLNKSACEAISICGFAWDDTALKNNSDEMVETSGLIVKGLANYFKDRFTYNLPWNYREEKSLIRQALPRGRARTKAQLRLRIKEGEPDQDDILSYIIRSNQCSDQLTIEDLVDEYLVFQAAGMETTAITMSITLFYLMNNPDVYQKAQKEVDEVFGDKEELTFEDVSKLVYLEMVIRECLRMKPPVHATGRECMKDNVIVDGLAIPKGAFLFIPQIVLQNDERYWKNPTKFDPERFSSKADTKIKAFTFMPFMAGPRSCIGKNFAILELKTIIAGILHQFVVVNPNPGLTELVTVGNITTRPAYGVRIKLNSKY